MTRDRAILELENMKHRFEDNVGGKMMVWPDSNDVEALEIAIEALEEQTRKENDGR